jgi:hypothetical protein
MHSLVIANPGVPYWFDHLCFTLATDHRLLHTFEHRCLRLWSRGYKLQQQSSYACRSDEQQLTSDSYPGLRTTHTVAKRLTASLCRHSYGLHRACRQMLKLSRAPSEI